MERNVVAGSGVRLNFLPAMDAEGTNLESSYVHLMRPVFPSSLLTPWLVPDTRTTASLASSLVVPSSCSRISKSSTTDPSTFVSHTSLPSEELQAVTRFPTALTTVSCSSAALRWPFPRGSEAGCCRQTSAPSLGFIAPIVWFSDIEYNREAFEPPYGFWKKVASCFGRPNSA